MMLAKKEYQLESTSLCGDPTTQICQMRHSWLRNSHCDSYHALC